MYSEPVLVVDDDPIFRAVAADALKALGVGTVLVAEDGSEGLELLARKDPPIGLIILDLNMPKLDGLAFMRNLPAVGFGGQVLILSGEDGSILKSALNLGKMLNANIVGALKKPLDDTQLAGALERCSEISKMEKAAGGAERSKDVAEVMLVPFYQPQFYIADFSLSGAEALTRIKLSDGQFASPQGYFERISHTEKARHAAFSTVRKVFSDISEWQFQGFDCDFAVNLDASVVEESGSAEAICELADEFAITPSTISIELTETALPKEMSGLLESLTRLRLAGFNLSIDDYGTGGANFDMLRLCPFTELKIDLSIIQSMEFDPIARHFFETTVDLAKGIGLRTVAEGIETESQLEMVRERAVDIGQGYLFGKPEPQVSFTKRLEDAEAMAAAS